jgi:hypothetical protein
MERDSSEHQKILRRQRLVDSYCRKSQDSQLSHLYRDVLLEIAGLVNDEEFDDYTLGQLLIGLFESKITKDWTGIDVGHLGDSDVIAVCAMHNSELLVKPYVEHHRNIGVNNFVFIDNHSDDKSVEMLRILADNGVKIDVWSADDKFDGVKAMGWKQRMFVHYGLDRWYLNLDIDEHATYLNHEQHTLPDLIQTVAKNGKEIVGGMLVDMYPDDNILDGGQNDLQTKYTFFDRDTYTKISSNKYKHRIFGGPRTRLFGRHPSLQKFPLAYVDNRILAVNPHFWYPYEVNEQADLQIGLLHYKFLPGDLEKYREYVRSGVHWDNSSQYRSYIEGIEKLGGANFFSSEHSLRYLGSSSLSKIVTYDNEKMICGAFSD